MKKTWVRVWQLLSRSFPHQHGLTLLEILIAMGIMTFISYGLFQLMTDSFRLRDKLGQDTEFQNTLQLATQMIQRDLQLLYSPIASLPQKQAYPTQLLSPPESAKLQMDLQKRGLLQRSSFWSSALLPSGLRPSRFIGTEKKMSFVSSSHLRLYKEKPESSFALITYEFRLDPQTGFLNLYRLENTDAFTLDVPSPSFSKEYVLISRIKAAKWAYYKREGDKINPQGQWDSDKQETLNTYPLLIVLDLEQMHPSSSTTSSPASWQGTYSFKPEGFPNGVPGSI